MRLRKLVLRLILLGTVVAAAAPSPAPDEIPWLDNYANAVREAKRTQKPIFLEFRCEA